MNTSKIALFDKNRRVNAQDDILSMFEHTDEEGILYIPEWPRDCSIYEESQRYYKCKMDWNFVDFDDASYYCEELYRDIKKIASKWNEISSESAEKVLPEELLKVWNRYLRGFELEGIDRDEILYIEGKYDNIAFADSLRDRISAGECDESDKSLYEVYKDIYVTDEEALLYDKYKSILVSESKKRVGDGLAAYDVIIRAQRLCTLMSIKAPDIIIQNEASLLAQAKVIHTYCTSMETVEDVE